MATVPTGKMERELRRLYMRWVHQLPRHQDDLHNYVAKFQRDSTDLIERMGGDVARLGILADFPAPKRLDLSLHVGTIYSDMELAAISAQIGLGLNPRQTAEALVQSGVDKSYRRLERLARTETVRAYWKNSWDSVEDLGLVMLWSAERGPRTCDPCLERDGMVVPSREVRDHPNGRCTLVAELPSRVNYKGSVAPDGSIYQDPAWVKTKAVTQETDTWKPTMTPEEADRWASDSVIQEVMYHGTGTDVAASGIMSSGFDLSKIGTSTSNRGVYGAGVYLTETHSVADVYAALGNVTEGAVITTRVNLKNPVEYLSLFRNEEFIQWQAAYAGPNEAFPDALSSFLQSAGYDGVIKRGSDKKIAELVVFDPRNIVVVGSEKR